MSTRVLKLRKIGETLGIYRESSGRAIEVAANTLGIDVDYLKSAEKGMVELTFVQYVSLAELYGVGFSAFFEKDNGYYNPPDIPQEVCKYIRQQLEIYCKEKHKTKNDVRTALGMSSSSFHYFFHGFSNFLNPRIAENVIALFNLTSNTLRSVCEDTKKDSVKRFVESPAEKPIAVEQDIQEDFNHVRNAVIIDQFKKNPNERNATMDALTMVTDALFFYKKRNEIVAELERIIKTAQDLIEEMKA